jgi:hypothetical protein
MAGKSSCRRANRSFRGIAAGTAPPQEQLGIGALSTAFRSGLFEIMGISAINCGFEKRIPIYLRNFLCCDVTCVVRPLKEAHGRVV